MSTESQTHIKEADVAILIAAIQNSVGPLQVDAEKIAKQLGMSLSTIPPKFSGIRKRYNIDIRVLNSGALRRNRGSPQKPKGSAKALEEISCVSPTDQFYSATVATSPSIPSETSSNSGFEHSQQGS